MNDINIKLINLYLLLGFWGFGVINGVISELQIQYLAFFNNLIHQKLQYHLGVIYQALLS
jgi:hypothetical protein